MPPKAGAKQLSVHSFFKPVLTDAERAAQQARSAAECQRSAEEAQRKKQRREVLAEEQAKNRQWYWH
jgi:hypothetical protein